MKIPRLVAGATAAVALAFSTVLVGGVASAQEIEPTATITPSTLTVTEFQTSGVTVELTGFEPGETADHLFGSEFSGGFTGTSSVADSAGVVTFDFVADAQEIVPTTYVLGAEGQDSGIVAAGTVEVIADAPAPTGTATITPSSLSQTAFRTTGVTAVLSGFEPGEDVAQIFASENSGGLTGVTAVADADGAVTFTFVAEAADVPAGLYRIGGEGADSGLVVFAEFTVVADAAPAPADTPAVTAPAGAATPVPATPTYTG